MDKYRKGKRKKLLNNLVAGYLLLVAGYLISNLKYSQSQ